MAFAKAAVPYPSRRSKPRNPLRPSRAVFGGELVLLCWCSALHDLRLQSIWFHILSPSLLPLFSWFSSLPSNGTVLPTPFVGCANFAATGRIVLQGKHTCCFKFLNILDMQKVMSFARSSEPWFAIIATAKHEASDQHASDVWWMPTSLWHRDVQPT